jgi:hypothetical protein
MQMKLEDDKDTGVKDSKPHGFGGDNGAASEFTSTF